jgi:hypothetical protein
MDANNEAKGWGLEQPEGSAPVSGPLAGPHEPSGFADERRATPDRRRKVVWAVVYGSFRPRRRGPARRGDDARYQAIDWHASHLLAVAISILLLSVADAFLTLTLLDAGAQEMNPVMALAVSSNAAVFAGLKMTMTGVSVVLMVCLARYRFMRLVRVELALYGVMAGYLALIAYELHLLGAYSDYPLF